MVLLVSFWERFNPQSGHLGIKMKILGILNDLTLSLRIFFIGKGSFYQTLRKARKIPRLYNIILFFLNNCLIKQEAHNSLYCPSDYHSYNLAN